MNREQEDVNEHPASEVFLSLAQFWRTRERLCVNDALN